MQEVNKDGQADCYCNQNYHQNQDSVQFHSQEFLQQIQQ